MPRPWRIRFAGAKYHVTSRGNGRQQIFLTADDYGRFLGQLQSALDLDEVILYAYACMPNHIHLLVETPKGNIHRFMQRQIGAHFGYASNGAVGKQRLKLRDMVLEDPALARRLQKLRKKLSSPTR